MHQVLQSTHSCTGFLQAILTRHSMLYSKMFRRLGHTRSWSSRIHIFPWSSLAVWTWPELHSWPGVSPRTGLLPRFVLVDVTIRVITFFATVWPNVPNPACPCVEV